jgi:dihydroorotase
MDLCCLDRLRVVMHVSRPCLSMVWSTTAEYKRRKVLVNHISDVEVCRICLDIDNELAVYIKAYHCSLRRAHQLVAM